MSWMPSAAMSHSKGSKAMSQKTGGQRAQRRTLSYKIALPVPFVDEVSSVRPRAILECIPSPVALVGAVFLHETLQLIRVDVVRANAGAGSEEAVEIVDETVKVVPEGTPYCTHGAETERTDRRHNASICNRTAFAEQRALYLRARRWSITRSGQMTRASSRWPSDAGTATATAHCDALPYSGA